MSTVIKNDLILNRTERITTAENEFQNGIISYGRVRNTTKRKDNLNVKYFFKVVQAFNDICLHAPKYF